jgi:hypothetical protein
MTINLSVLDKNLAVKDPEKDVLWYDIRTLGTEGKGWKETERLYDRLPLKAKDMVPEPVWNLSRHSAGLCVRFQSDATSISAKWTLLHQGLSMNHMPATGVSGLDLYVLCEGEWRWLSVARPSLFPTNSVLMAGVLPPGGMRHFMLYLPLYNGTESVQLGIPPAARIEVAPDLPNWNPPIVFYGTSIVQGGCASRPGMAHTAILGRRLRRSVINLGFSGNGRMESSLATLLGEIDAAAYVLDCLPNMNVALIAERAGKFVETLRAIRPRTPIIMVENVVYQYEHMVELTQRSSWQKNEALRKVYASLQAAGVENLYHVPADDLYGHDWEATVDGAHATDVGFMRMADAIEPTLRRVL